MRLSCSFAGSIDTNRCVCLYSTDCQQPAPPAVAGGAHAQVRGAVLATAVCNLERFGNESIQTALAAA